MKIIADTATLIPPAEGESLGMTIIPVCVSINNKIYQDYSQITSTEFLKQIAEGGALKLLPVLTQTQDKTRITSVSIKRSWNSAVETVLQRLQEVGVGAEHLISVCHAGTPQKAERILAQVKARFAASEAELLELSPALITHGGPGCIVIQAIHK